MSEKKILGIIAGSGKIPLFIGQKARKEGYSVFAAGIRDEFDPKLKKLSHWFTSFEVKDFLDLISSFKKKEVSECVFAGKIKHKIIYSKEISDSPLFSLFQRTETRNPDDILKTVFDYVEKQGIKVIDFTRFLSDLFCEPGILTGQKVDPSISQDIDYGWSVAKKAADHEIGQTVVIKNKAVVAVEGMEGTDQAIIRGGELAGKNCVVIKVGRTAQDIRIDQPAVGLNTVKALKKVGCSALCIEARKVMFLEKEKALKLAEQNGISVMVQEPGSSVKRI